MAAVVKAREECDAAHTIEEEARRETLKDDDHGDPVVRLLHVTRTAARAQCEKAVDAFLSSIEKTLQKHVPAHTQGPLISNALSTAFQFQMRTLHFGLIQLVKSYLKSPFYQKQFLFSPSILYMVYSESKC